MLARGEAVLGIGKGPDGHEGEVPRGMVLCSHLQQGALGGTRAQGPSALSWCPEGLQAALGLCHWGSETVEGVSGPLQVEEEGE